jgi:Anti-sigma-K factor rskA
MSADQNANLNLSPRAVNPGGPRHPNPDDLALYAMQLLTSEETAAVAQHLEHCAPCREELARILGDLAATALTVDIESPAAPTRDRLLKQVAREKKIVSIAPSQPAQTQSQPPIAAFGRTAPVLSIESAQPKPAANRSVVAWSGWGVAAALAVAISFLYGDRKALKENLASESGQIQRLNASAANSHQLLDALTDPRAVRVTLTAKPLPRSGPTGGVTYNPTKGTLVFLASQLDPLQAYKTYELWLIPQDGGAPLPAGTFHPDDQGNASVIMPDLPRGVTAKAFGVTIEEDGGSQTPTMPIIMAGS